MDGGCDPLTTAIGEAGVGSQAVASESGSMAYDPADHTVDEVKAYADSHPADAPGLLTAERAGRSRVTLIDYLERF